MGEAEGWVSARNAILARVRRSLGVSGSDPARLTAVAERFARAPRGVIPAHGRLQPEERIGYFTEKALQSHAKVQRVVAVEVPRTIARFLETLGVAPVVRMGSDPRLAAMPWEGSGLRVEHDAPAPEDRATVSHADAGIAETGTAVLVSGPANPSLLAFLPDVHVIVLRAGDIAANAETAIERVRRSYPDGRPPRAVTFVTGPSRSADIEQTLCIGAHGPREVLVLIVD
jgi:L-lactate dehydrogenase complex protein LldG